MLQFWKNHRRKSRKRKILLILKRFLFLTKESELFAVIQRMRGLKQLFIPKFVDECPCFFERLLALKHVLLHAAQIQ